VELEGRLFPHVRSYALNAYVGWLPTIPPVNSASYVNFAKTGDFAPANPSAILTFVDTAPGHVCMPVFLVGLGGLEGCFRHLPAASHTGMGVVAFADGHVEGRKWLEAETVALARTNWLPDHFSLWLYENRDRRWITDHATVRTTAPQ
jgi:prepilin-type processing-associated H-X9-DG protein